MRSAAESFGFSDEGITQIVLDSRKDISNGLFVPIVGERSDGHDYIEMAIAHGAVAVLSQRDVSELQARFPKVRFYQVEDTRLALQEIGYMERLKFHGTVIGVTGSVGKTTTRNMIAAALGSQRRVFQTAGNANSQVGVPITMFEMARSGAELAVIELGMSEPGEMTRIARVACVDMAVMTNIGIAHIEQLKTQENILREKLHILDGMRDGGTLLLNGEDPLLSSVTEEKLHAYGIMTDRSVKLRQYSGAAFTAALSVRGAHMRQNAAAAMEVCRTLGLAEEPAAAALAAFTGVKGRGEVLRLSNGVTVIDDAYNASPVSMKAGLSVLAEMEGTKRIAVLADMLELGEKSAEYHAEVGACLAKLSIETVFLYGERAKDIGAGVQSALKAGDQAPEIHSFTDFSELEAAVAEAAGPGTVFLFKGSNSMGLSKLVDRFRQQEAACTQES